MNFGGQGWSGLRLRRGGILRLALLAIPWSALLLGCASGHRANAAAFTVSAARVGSLKIAPSTSYASVSRYLKTLKGAHPQTSFLSGECRVSSVKYSVKFVLLTLSQTGSNRQSDCRISLIEMTSSLWHTSNGLRPGDTLAKLRRLFPRAINAGKNTGGNHWARPINAFDWWLAPVSDNAEHPNLEAYVKDGRVIALVISIIGH